MVVTSVVIPQKESVGKSIWYPSLGSGRIGEDPHLNYVCVR